MTFALVSQFQILFNLVGAFNQEKALVGAFYVIFGWTLVSSSSGGAVLGQFSAYTFRAAQVVT